MYIALLQNESYRQSPEKTKNNGEHEKRDNIRKEINIKSLELEIYMFWAFLPNIPWYGQNSQWIHSIFPNGKSFSQFIDKFLKF